MKASIIFLQIAALVASVSAHGKLISPLGLNVEPAVDLGSQADVSLGVSKNKPCGFVLGKAAPNLDSAIQTPRATFAPGSQADLQYFIVNQDGAGPLSVSFSADGGQTWTAAKVTKNAPGQAGINLANLNGGSQVPVSIQVPDMNCPAGSCVMMVKNPITFGSCAPVEIKAGAQNQFTMTFENQGGKPVGQGLRGAAAGGIGAAVDKPAKANKGGVDIPNIPEAANIPGVGDVLGGVTGGAAKAGGAAGAKAGGAAGALGGLGDILEGILGGAQ